MEREPQREPKRATQIVRGISVVLAVSLFLALVFSLQFLPGPVGVAAGWMAGVITTPFIMETSLCITGFIVVILLNNWRRHREGDEFVYLEQVKDGPANLPPQASWAIYREKPLEAPHVADRDLLEGALAIEDYDAALQILTAMDDEERQLPEVIRMRITLAQATGLQALAKRLQTELDGRIA